MDATKFRMALLHARVGQNEFAKRIGVSGATLSLFLNGKMVSARIAKAVTAFTDAEWKKISKTRCGTKMSDRSDKSDRSDRADKEKSGKLPLSSAEPEEKARSKFKW